MVTQEYLKEHFLYDPEGFLIRKKTGKRAGSKITSLHRYSRINLFGRQYFTHRLIFLMLTGELPTILDHINGDCADNRIENLRVATQNQNCLNRRHHRNSASPYKNVWWHKATQKWCVRITMNGVSKVFGYFDDIEFADLVAVEAREKFCGSFLRHA